MTLRSFLLFLSEDVGFFKSLVILAISATLFLALCIFLASDFEGRAAVNDGVPSEGTVDLLLKVLRTNR
jgi:hypothetical protein